MLVLEEGDELPDAGVAHRGEGHLGVDDVEAGQDAPGPFLAQARGEDLAGELDAAAADEVLRGHEPVELVHDVVDVLGLDRAQAHQFTGQGLDLARAQLAEEDAGFLLAHLSEEDRGLPQSGEFGTGDLGRHRRNGAAPEPDQLLDTGDGHALDSLNQPRSMAATSSGFSLTMAEMSPLTFWRSAASSSSAALSTLTLGLVWSSSRVLEIRSRSSSASMSS